MPDKRAHRGAHPQDATDFAPESWPPLQAASADLSFLLTRHYSVDAALKLVGDHHQLTARQRMAVRRGSCSQAALEHRRATRVLPASLLGARVGIDGFNCLITLECMLSGAPVFVGRDGAHRDLASVHGTYRRVEETWPALTALRDTLTQHAVGAAVFYLDRPVSNSGRLRAMIERCFAPVGFSTSIILCEVVDPVIVREERIVASSDSWVLDHAEHWLDLPLAVAQERGLSVALVPLASG